jgi:hypothetical protein
MNDEVLLKQVRADLERDRTDLLVALKDLPSGTEDPVTEMLRAGLSDLELAMRKLNEGRYGICESCRGRIEEKRLLTLPASRICSKCEAESFVGLRSTDG